ncbi:MULTISPECIES: DNA-3-methyladenine glycosylase [Staphylococcus]|uniref:DNA-3-methyladenine glycosylase family protein n=1 Tax=Staphylococcus TaxID=1279 RepID=UPI000D1C1443|nr:MULTISPECIES: DNA-3-methyladenine glycosylase [Staphylococcus]MDQ7111368.1 DNA-3-methyladenine glycosylase [Staphylococcus ureilyticus]MDU9348283.1 DNA-3-methyladenine glycosylase [Staphylococcus ureilyticus]PTG49096.1 DNA-3-methyladenine glycosylase 2 family protein [Staphylococcus cohnii]RIL86135.1 DNA-3-methyladenine glycosylase 2 family protein [Staphylococcus cohnii]
MTQWQIDINDPVVQTLMNQDETLAKLIKQIGNIEITLRTNPLKSLIRSIIGQQITNTAASAISQKFSDAIHNQWTLESILSLKETQMKHIGLSKTKINYIQNLLAYIEQNKLDFANLHELDDKTVKQVLTQVKGIGRWTSEIFLIFTLKRENILPIFDVGLQRAAQWLYQTSTAERKKQLTLCAKQWHPYASYGAFYLWEAIHRNLLNYDSIDSVIDKSTS